MSIETTSEIKIKASQREHARLGAEHIFLAAAVIASTVLLAAWFLDVGDRLGEHGRTGIKIALSITWVGYIVRSAETRVTRVLDRRAATAERARREGYAAGYVDGAARRTPEESARLRPVN